MANEYDSSAVEVQSAIAIIEGSGHSGMNQDRGLKSADQMLACQRSAQERRLRPQADQILKCPRCESLNTKFCYYNNYSLTQPRHFCKNCKRYWTKGGALRNIPVGGGSRKNKRARQRNSDQSMLSSSSEELVQNGGHVQGTNNIVQLENLRSNMQLQDHSDGAVLSYDRIDDSTEILTSENSPVSINWPSAAVANLPISFQQHFDAGVLGMNLAKQDHQVSMNPNGDLCSLFDHQAPNSSAISEGFSTYTACYDETDGKGETHWRFPQQKLVALLQEGIQEGRNSYLQALEDDGTDLLRHVKGKLAQELIQVKSEEQAEWHHVEDGFLEPSNESGYWNNGNWS